MSFLKIWNYLFFSLVLYKSYKTYSISVLYFSFLACYGKKVHSLIMVIWKSRIILSCKAAALQWRASLTNHLHLFCSTFASMRGCKYIAGTLIAQCLCHLSPCSCGGVTAGANSLRWLTWQRKRNCTTTKSKNQATTFKDTIVKTLPLYCCRKITAVGIPGLAFICLLLCQSTLCCLLLPLSSAASAGFELRLRWPSAAPAAGNVWSLLRRGSVRMSTAGPTSQESWSFFPLVALFTSGAS